MIKRWVFSLSLKAEMVQRMSCVERCKDNSSKEGLWGILIIH